MFSLIKNEKGFSYAEILVAVVILGLIFNSAFFVYERGIAWWNKGDKEIDLQQHLRIALDRMSKDVRQAVPSTIKHLDSYGNVVTREDGKLELNDSIEFDIKTKSNGVIQQEKVTYKRTLGKILKNGQPVAENITDVYFEYDGAKRLVVIKIVGTIDEISITLDTKSYVRTN